MVSFGIARLLFTGTPGDRLVSLNEAFLQLFSRPLDFVVYRPCAAVLSITPASFITFVMSSYENDLWSPSQLFDAQLQEIYGNSSLMAETPRLINTPTSISTSRDATPSPHQELTFASLSDFPRGAIDRDDQQGSIRFNIEWKLTVNRRSKVEDTEQNVVVSPRNFWEAVLKSKLETVARKKLPVDKSFQVEDTVITVSVKGKRDLKKRYEGLDIDWSVPEKQLWDWKHFLSVGKELCIHISFNYKEVAPASASSRPRTSRLRRRRNAGSATELMLQELESHVDSTGEPLPWRQVRSLLRCPGPPCLQGPYCWRDSETKKRYKLRTPHLLRLVKYVEEGNALDTHDDMPADVRETLYLEDQQRLDRQDRATPGRYPPINITNVLPSFRMRWSSFLPMNSTHK
ncbi:hypothetical protein JX266_013830 [Neoarthrinium moseri]|nr:hypothetical protein JX266_013830 [Neoarthrinium moseri]